MDRTPLESTESAANVIKRVTYSHDLIIDHLITNPRATRKDISDYFGYTEAWLSRIMNSDAFNAVLAQRRSELIDPVLTASIKENLTSVAQKSMEVVLKKLENPMAMKMDDAIKAMDVATKALGYGAREQSNVTNVQQNIVIVPPKSDSSDDWLTNHSPRVIQG